MQVTHETIRNAAIVATFVGFALFALYWLAVGVMSR